MCQIFPLVENICQKPGGDFITHASWLPAKISYILLQEVFL